MKPRDDGGPAFPCSDPRNGEPYHGGLYGQPPSCGLSIRDYFAGQALSGLYASGRYSNEPYGWYGFVAYSIADAMLKERAKERA